MVSQVSTADTMEPCRASLRRQGKCLESLRLTGTKGLVVIPNRLSMMAFVEHEATQPDF
jgi:hypothetical protein